jgi:polyisoprenoid-binding protein YceI
MPLTALRLALPVLAGAIGLAATAPKPYDIDRAHSEITFVANARLFDATGFFDTFTVNVAFDPDTIVNSTVQIVIAPQYVNTRNASRDRHLRSCDFFCVDSFPAITFQSSAITRVGPDRYNIDGAITMRGVTKPLTVPARMIFVEGGRARFNGGFWINRRDFGVNGQGGGGIIHDSVEVKFNFSLRDPAMRRGGQAPAAPTAPATPPRSQ